MKIIISILLCIFLNIASGKDVHSAGAAKVLRVPLFKMKSPMQQMVESGIDMKEAHRVLEASSKRTNDSIPLYKFLDSQYYAVIGVGHPLQPINVIFDTSWSDSWVMSAKCTWKFIPCIFHKKYDASKSFTFRNLNKTFNLTLGKSVLAGIVANDTIYIEHSNVTNQTFGAASQVPFSYVFSKASGVIGLGFEGSSLWSKPTLMYNLYAQRRISKPVFSIYINRHITTESGGNIFFGGSEPKHCNSSFSYIRIYDPFYWQFPIQSVQVIFSKHKGELFCIKKCTALIDSSTTAIAGPKDDIEKINNIIGATKFLFGKYTVKCNTVSKLPHIAFFFAKRNFTISGEEYIQRMSVGPLQICVSAFVVNTAFNDSITWSLGAAFLSRFYTVFDIQDRTIGFADLRY